MSRPSRLRRPPMHRATLRPLCLALALAGVHGAALALPETPKVVQGSVTVQQPATNLMNITQTTQKAVVEWQRFSISLGEQLRIVQPNSRAVLLNRVVGIDPSLILGQLSANGRVFLSNPRGIVFGQSARVDVGGLLATTLDIQGQDASGRWQLSAPSEGTPGAIEVDGRLSAPHGTLAIVAPQVTVRGEMLGQRVGVAAASRALVDVEGDGLIFFDVGNDGLDTRLEMLGRLQADGGTVDMRAQARAGFADTVLNMEGIVRARSIGQRGGQVVIDGGTAGVVRVSGEVDATGLQAGERGGRMQVLGEKVGLTGQALLDASGDAGGGQVLVGGGFQGHGLAHNAQHVFVGSGVQLRADATRLGDGGEVVVWSDQSTRYFGQLSARGGALGGHGGLAEVSGKVSLDFQGGADLGAAHGERGRLWLDPDNLTIGTTADADGEGTGEDIGDPTIGDSIAFGSYPGKDSLVTATQLNTLLATTNVTLQATQDVTVQTAVSAAAGSGSLTLDAGRNLAINQNVAVGGGLTLRADSAFAGGSDGTGTLTVASGRSLSSTSGQITLSGAAITFSGSNSLSAGTNVSVTSTGSGVALPTTNAGGNITVTSAGSITDGGVLTVGADGSSFTTSTSGQSISLATSTHAFGGRSAAFQTSGAAGNVAIKANNLTLGASTIGGKLTATTTAGGIDQSGVITTGATGSSFTVNSGQSIDLSSQANSFTGAGSSGVSFSGATNIGFRNVGGIQLGATTAAGTISLTSDSGSITDGGVLTVGANGSSFTTSTSGQSISLATSTHAFGGRSAAFQTSGASGDVAIKANNLTLAASTIGGKLTATTTAGGIDQSGVLTTGATGSSFTVSSGQSIDLSTQANSFTGAGSSGVSFSGATNIAFRNVGSIELGATTAAGTISLTSDSGSITDGGVLTVGADGSSFTTSTSGQSIDLGTSTHAFGGRSAAFQTSGGTGNVAIKANNLTLGASTIGGKLTATTTAGGIDQSGVLTTGATGSSFTVSSGQSIDLSTQANSFAGAGSSGVSFSGATNIAFRNVGSIQLGATTAAGQIDLTSDSGSITDGGVLTVGANGSSFTTSASGQSIDLGTSTHAFGGRTVAFQTSGTSGDVAFKADDLTLAASTIGGRLTATTTAGGIDQTGVITTGATGSSFTVSGGQSIDLSTQANSFTGAGSGGVSFSGATDIGFRNVGSIELGATTAAGKINLTSDSGNITDGGALTVGANGSSFTTSTAGRSISLATSTHAFGGRTVAFQTSGSAGDVALQADDIDLAASTIGGKLTATATTGNIAQTGAISLGATGSSFTTLASDATITLDQANTLGNTTLAFSTTGTGGDVTVNGTALSFAASTIGGKLVASTTSGGIGQTGAITTGATGSSFTLATGQSVDLSTQANSFTGADSGGVSFSNATNIGFRNVGSIQLGATTAAGQIDLTSDSGSITDGGVLTVGANGSSFTTSTAGQTIDLSTSTHAFGGRSVAFQTSGTGGSVSFKADDFALAASSVGGDLTATATTGDIDQSGVLTLGGSTASFTTQTADRSISLNNSGNLLSGASLEFATSGSSGDVTVTGDVLALGSSSVGGKLVATATAGGITQSGALVLGAAGSSFSTSATSNATVVLDNTGNDFANTTLAFSTTGTSGDVTLVGNTLGLGGSTLGGKLTATANTGGISQTGAITTGATGSSFTVSSGQSIDLSTQANSLTGAGSGGVSFSGATDIGFRNVGSIELGATTAAGKINLTSDSGNITDGGVLTVGANGSSFTTSTAGRSISLATSTHAFGGRTVAFQTSGNAGDVALQADDIDLAASTIGGKFTATATTGNIAQTGAISLGATGSSFTTLASDATITLDQANTLGNTTLAFSTTGTGGDVTVNGTALSFAGSTIGGKLVATATTGTIGQTGALQLGAAGSSFSTSTANRSITLANTGNLFADTTLALNTTGSTGHATVTGDTLTFATSTLGGRLTATTTSGGIDQSGALTTGASGSSFTVASGQSVILSTQANGLAGAGTGGVSFNNATDLALRNVGSIQLGATTAAGKINLTSDAGSITDGGVLTVGADGSSFTTSTAGQVISLATSTHALGGHTVAFQTSGAAGNAAVKADDLVLAASNVGGKLVATATTGDIVQTGALVLGAAGSSFTTSTAGRDITLDNTGNNFAGTTIALTTSGATGDASLTGDALTLAASSVGGKLTATTLTGGIGQTGVLSLGASGSQFTAAAGQSIDLSSQANQFGSSTVGFATTGSGNVAVRSNSLVLAASQAGGDFTARVDGGSLTQTGSLQVGGQTTLQAGSGTATVALQDAGNVISDVQLASAGGTLGTVSLRTAGAQTVAGDATALTVDSAAALVLAGGTYGSLTATARGSITQTGAVSVSGVATLATDTAGSTVQLDNAANEWHQVDLAPTGAGRFDTVALTDRDQTRVDGLQFGGNAGAVQVDAGGTLVMSGSSLSSLAVTSTGSVTQTGALQVTGASSFTARGSGIDLTLNQAGNSLPDVQLAASGGGSWNQVNLVTTGAQTVSGDATALALTTGGGLTLGGGAYNTLTAAVGGPVTQTGALSISGLASFTAQGAGLAATLDNAGNELNQVALVSGSGSFGTVQLVEADIARPDGLTLSGQAAALQARTPGPVQLGAGQWGQLSVDTSSGNGSITQTAAQVVTGATLLNAGTGSIALGRTDNQLASVSVAGASTASLADSNGFSLGDSAVSTSLSLQSAGTISVTGQVSGTAAVVKSGSGTLAVTGPQLWSGGTQVVAGTLSVSGSTASIGSGDLQLAAGTVLALGPDASLPNDLLSQGATLRQVAGNGELTGDLVLGGTSTLDTASGTELALQGPVSGTGFGLVKTGLGTAVLSGANTTTGLSTVNQGTLVAAAEGSLSDTAALQVNAGGTVVLGAAQTVGSLAGGGQVTLDSHRLTAGANGASTLFSGQISGSGGLTKTGAGTFTLSGDNLYTGSTVVAQGRLATASAQRIADGSALVVAGGATLQLGGDETVGSLAGEGQVALAGHRLTAGGDGSDTAFSGNLTGAGSLTKTGAGSLALSGTNQFGGLTRVEEGQLVITQSSALTTGSALQVAGGAELLLQADAALASLTGTGDVVLDGTRLGVGTGNASSRFDGSLKGQGSLQKTGSGTASWGGTSDFSGTTQVDAGTLLIDGQFTGLPQLVVAPGATLSLGADQRFGSISGGGQVTLAGFTLRAGANDADTLFSGVISGAGRLIKQGDGTLALSGTNTFSGGTTVESGVLQLGDGGASGDAGTGPIVNDGLLRVVRTGELRLDAPVTGSGELELAQGTLTLGSTGNDWTGDTRVLAGLLQTTGAERLPDATAVSVASAGRLLLAGNEHLGAVDAQGQVTAQGSIFTSGAQTYAGGLTLQGGADVTLSGTEIEAGTELNSLGTGTLSLAAQRVNLRSAAQAGGTHEALALGDVTVGADSQIVAGRLSLAGTVQVQGGTLNLVADAAPDPSGLTAVGTVQVPGTQLPLAFWEDTVQQQGTGTITVASGAQLLVQATGGGSVSLMQDSNQFLGTLSVLSGPKFNTAWQAQTAGLLAPVSLVEVAGDQVRIGGSGIEADVVHVRANQLQTVDTATLTARLPFDNLGLGSNLSLPSMVLELAPQAFSTDFPFGNADNTIKVVVGAKVTGGRTTGPDGGFLTVLPKNGASGSTAVFLSGPLVAGGYSFFHDGAGKQTEIPVFYNGALPKSPQLSGSLAAVAAVSEAARKERFEEAVRTENVTVRLRSGVIAEVGPGRPATVGSEGAATPPLCEPKSNSLQCQ